MGILLKNEIKNLIEDPAIQLVGSDFRIENLQSCSYDLRIGSVFKNGKIYSSYFNSSENFDIEIKPSEIVTILTLEEVNLPLNIIGTVFAINGLSSTGFLILNPGHIDPGFKGPISICAINLSKHSIRLYRGKNIFTLILERLENDAEPYKNKPYENRADRESDFHRNKAVKLSASLFDLIKENEYTPYLKDSISSIIKEKMYFYLKWLFGVLATIATILGGIYLVVPTHNDEKPLLNKIDSLEIKIKDLDTLLKFRKENSILKLRIDSLSKNNTKTDNRKNGNKLE